MRSSERPAPPWPGFAIASDFDGTLFDTQDAVFEAYSAVGIDYQEAYWGLAWDEWLPMLCGGLEAAKAIHERKQAEYRRILDENPSIIKVLPLARVLPVFKYTLLTAASEAAVMEVMRYFPELAPQNSFFGRNIKEKGRLLKVVSWNGIYFDDNAHAGRGIVDIADHDWKFLHVTPDKSEEVLRQEIKETLWTL